MQQPVHLPDFIPEDLQQAFGEEARHRVEHHAASRRGPNAMPSAAGRPDRSPTSGLPPLRAERTHGRDQRRDLIAAILLALPGTVLLSALWAWLAITTNDVVWWFPAVGGMTTAAALAVAVWRARARDELVTSRSRPQPIQDEARAEPTVASPHPNT